MARHNVVRKIKNRTTIILVMLLISIMVSWVIWGNLSVETTKLTVTSKDLPEAFDKFSIAHISDLHNAEYGKNNEKLIDILEAESPNIIAITGDLIDSNHTNLEVAWNNYDCEQRYWKQYHSGENQQSTGNSYYRVELWMNKSVS